MKTRTSLFLALGSLCLAATLAAAPEPRARGYRVVAIETLNCPTIEMGTPRRQQADPISHPSGWRLRNLQRATAV